MTDEAIAGGEILNIVASKAESQEGQARSLEQNEVLTRRRWPSTGQAKRETRAKLLTSACISDPQVPEQALVYLRRGTVAAVSRSAALKLPSADSRVDKHRAWMSLSQVGARRPLFGAIVYSRYIFAACDAESIPSHSQDALVQCRRVMGVHVLPFPSPAQAESIVQRPAPPVASASDSASPRAAASQP